MCGVLPMGGRDSIRAERRRAPWSRPRRRRPYRRGVLVGFAPCQPPSATGCGPRPPTARSSSRPRPGRVYVDRENGESMQIVGKLLPLAPSQSRLPWAVENLRFCNWCDQLCSARPQRLPALRPAHGPGRLNRGSAMRSRCLALLAALALAGGLSACGGDDEVTSDIPRTIAGPDDPDGDDRACRRTRRPRPSTTTTSTLPQSDAARRAAAGRALRRPSRRHPPRRPAARRPAPAAAAHRRPAARARTRTSRTSAGTTPAPARPAEPAQPGRA